MTNPKHNKKGNDVKPTTKQPVEQPTTKEKRKKTIDDILTSGKTKIKDIGKSVANGYNHTKEFSKRKLDEIKNSGFGSGLSDKVSKTINYMNEHKKRFITGAAIIGLTSIAGLGITNYLNQKSQYQNKLREQEAIVMQLSNKENKLRKEYENMMSKYSKKSSELSRLENSRSEQNKENKKSNQQINEVIKNKSKNNQKINKAINDQPIVIEEHQTYEILSIDDKTVVKITVDEYKVNKGDTPWSIAKYELGLPENIIPGFLHAIQDYDGNAGLEIYNDASDTLEVNKDCKLINGKDGLNDLIYEGETIQTGVTFDYNTYEILDCSTITNNIPKSIIETTPKQTYTEPKQTYTKQKPETTPKQTYTEPKPETTPKPKQTYTEPKPETTPKPIIEQTPEPKQTYTKQKPETTPEPKQTYTEPKQTYTEPVFSREAYDNIDCVIKFVDENGIEKKDIKAITIYQDENEKVIASNSNEGFIITNMNLETIKRWGRDYKTKITEFVDNNFDGIVDEVYVSRQRSKKDMESDSPFIKKKKYEISKEPIGDDQYGVNIQERANNLETIIYNTATNLWGSDCEPDPIITTPKVVENISTPKREEPIEMLPVEKVKAINLKPGYNYVDTGLGLETFTVEDSYHDDQNLSGTAIKVEIGRKEPDKKMRVQVNYSTGNDDQNLNTWNGDTGDYSHNTFRFDWDQKLFKVGNFSIVGGLGGEYSTIDLGDWYNTYSNQKNWMGDASLGLMWGDFNSDYFKIEGGVSYQKINNSSGLFGDTNLTHDNEHGTFVGFDFHKDFGNDWYVEGDARYTNMSSGNGTNYHKLKDGKATHLKLELGKHINNKWDWYIEGGFGDSSDHFNNGLDTSTNNSFIMTGVKFKW